MGSGKMRGEYLIRRYAQEHEGSVTHLINGCTTSSCGTGTVLEKYAYDAFGAPTFMDGGGNNRNPNATIYNNRFLFTGREYAATYRGTNVSTFSFYEYRARAYNPILGRFMSEDPKLFGAGDYNLFRYCHNDPMDFTDAMGLETNNAQTGPPVSGHNVAIAIQAEEYGRLMAAIQWAGSNLMHGASGAIGIGMAGYQEWSTFQKGLASAMKGQGHDPVIGGKNYYSHSSWQKAGEAYARIAQIYTDAYHLEYNGYLYQNKDNSPDFIGTTPPQAGSVGPVKDAFVSGIFNRSEFVDKAHAPQITGYTPIGVYVSQVLYARGIARSDQLKMKELGYYGVISTPPAPGGSRTMPHSPYHYDYVNDIVY